MQKEIEKVVDYVNTFSALGIKEEKGLRELLSKLSPSADSSEVSDEEIDFTDVQFRTVREIFGFWSVGKMHLFKELLSKLLPPCSKLKSQWVSVEENINFHCDCNTIECKGLTNCKKSKYHLPESPIK